MSLVKLKFLAYFSFVIKVLVALSPILILILLFASINGFLNFSTVGWTRLTLSLVTAVAVFVLAIVLAATTIFVSLLTFNAKYKQAWRAAKDERDIINITAGMLKYIRVSK